MSVCRMSIMKNSLIVVVVFIDDSYKHVHLAIKKLNFENQSILRKYDIACCKRNPKSWIVKHRKEPRKISIQRHYTLPYIDIQHEITA